MRLTTPNPPHVVRPYREYFGVMVDQSPDQSATFSAEDAARPFLTANEGMWEFFEPELRRRLSELEAGASMADRVAGALLELLPAGELGVSTRTLQRRLKTEGTTFQASLGYTRESLARHYLSSTSMSAAEISFLLGYDDPNSFYRAFHAWTGQTPERVRGATT